MAVRPGGPGISELTLRLKDTFENAPQKLQHYDEIINWAIEERNKARHERDFKKADEIRKKLGIAGVVLEDKKGGTDYRVVTTILRPPTGQ